MDSERTGQSFNLVGVSRDGEHAYGDQAAEGGIDGPGWPGQPAAKAIPWSEIELPLPASAAFLAWHNPYDADRDPHHWSYKIPGLLVWLLIAATAITLLEDPRLALACLRLLGLYVLFRVLVTVFFYPVGLLRCHLEEQTTRRHVRASGDGEAAVHHIVVVPNYKEPPEILERTLSGLAAQHNARLCLTVVLAMEAAESGAEAKANALSRRFAGCFAHILVTCHPANLPGEVPGKACNQRWAARQARHYLVESMGFSIDHLTLTSCDADSLLNPYYFAAIGRMFASDPERHFRYYQSPMRFDNNIWRVPAPIRVLTLLANALNLSELANPFVLKLTHSTYTFSLKLAEAIDYWDSRVVAEDSHILLRGFFASRGRANLRPVFLPTSGDAVTGDTVWDALRNFYRQRTRHAWGCQNTGYVLQQWSHRPGIALSQKLLFLLQVIQDYSLFATATLILAAGWLLGSFSTRSPVVSFFNLAIPAFLFVAVNALGMVGTLCTWAAEHLRVARSIAGWRPGTLIGDLVTWLLLPIFTLALAVFPVLHANTKMLIGSSLGFVRTHKEGAGTAQARTRRRSPDG